TVPRGTVTPQDSAGEARRKALLFGELRRARESPCQRATVPSVFGGQTDPGTGPPDSPPGRPSRTFPACRPKRVTLLGTRPAPPSGGGARGVQQPARAPPAAAPEGCGACPQGGPLWPLSGNPWRLYVLQFLRRPRPPAVHFPWAGTLTHAAR